MDFQIPPTPPPDDGNEPLPLRVLAPTLPGASRPLATHEYDGRETVLYRSEFGYDCRVDGDSKIPHPERRRVYGVVAAALVIVALAIVSMQPGARSALGSLFHSSSTPSSQPTSAPVSAVLPLSTAGSPSPSPAGTPKPATPAVHLTTVVTPGKPVSCPQGTGHVTTCSWTLKLQAIHALNIVATWPAKANVTINVTSTDGAELGTNSASQSGMSLSVPTPPSEVIVSVTVTSSGAASINAALST